MITREAVTEIYRRKTSVGEPPTRDILARIFPISLATRNGERRCGDVNPIPN